MTRFTYDGGHFSINRYTLFLILVGTLVDGFIIGLIVGVIAQQVKPQSEQRLVPLANLMAHHAYRSIHHTYWLGEVDAPPS